jgi:serine/threonine-protein kinase ATR
MTRGATTCGQLAINSNDADIDMDPPPSTITAQLVNDISTANGRQRSIDRENLEQLLLVVLETSDDGIGVTPVDNVANHKLINVIAQAGLEDSEAENPFVKTSKCLSLVSNCVAAIQLTIKKSPDVLFFNSLGPFRDNVQGGPPLYLWLFPRVLALAARPAYATIQDKIMGLISSSWDVLECSPHLWHALPVMLGYCRSCVEGKPRAPILDDGRVAD